ncbi:receptor for retinol uptake stra6 isoform X1 [Erpetoichthys calabaricus]|uniref:Receptor for retinol uptake STRA6 n=2 Tax=Erpetoichthys calabaricus TaxID=27687 RepID=A0A8C4TN40_ERPCA|nr:receptor for retinol uptake stra6 isoform X1 [Erpetoichthys calabaricus]XP_051776590.1 receptor for retinol uptake stra6 isoform X1 [Erpetoichthys calabaricus]XP_051776591.1 receptor for retinol uptake stra6 isoform X1 [Erpetoichthys calabaricus]
MGTNEPTDYDDDSWYSNDPLEPTSPPKEVIEPCDPTVPDNLYHICILALSLVILLVLAAFTRRKRLCLGLFNGVPGLLSPVNMLNQTQHKGLATAVFGLLMCKLSILVMSKNPLPFIKESSPTTQELWKILALFYYPLLYYPLLACGSLQSRVGYVLGSLLSWTHFAVLVWQKSDCPRTPEIYKYHSLLSSFPQMGCLAFLSFQYPLLLFKNFNTESQTNASEDLKSSYYKDYVRKILRKPIKISLSPETPNLQSRVKTLLSGYIYKPEDDFRFPLKVAISSVVAFVTVYQVALLLVVQVVPVLQKMRAGVKEDIVYVLAGFGIVLSESKAEVVELVRYYFWVVEVCYNSALTLSCLVTLTMLMRSMVLHRLNLQGLYRGDIYAVYNCQRSIRPSRPALVCWMSFTSYQSAFVCLGMLIQTVVFFICLLWFVFLILFPILYGRHLFAFRILQAMWPLWLTLCLAGILQHVAAKFAFLKKDGGTLDLDNRHALFLLTYLLFPVNVLVGFLVALWRMVISSLYNIIHFSRLDISLLNRAVESFDPGYRCYAHYLKVEVSQSHPVMKAFCSLLLQSQCLEEAVAQRIQDAEEGIQLVQQDKKKTKISKSRVARARWWLLFTLVNNPSLVASRKHFQCQSAEAFYNGTLNRDNKGSEKKPEKAEA